MTDSRAEPGPTSRRLGARRGEDQSSFRAEPEPGASGQEPGGPTAAVELPPRDLEVFWPAAFSALARAAGAAGAAPGPEEALRELTAVAPVVLGDKQAHLRPGALKPGEHQFAICGAFMLTGDRRHNLLIAEVGFPVEQHRLRIDVGLGHPGWVVAHRAPLILANTDRDPSFKQILKTSRMGSALYAPMIWRGELLGQLVCASQARNTYAQADLDVLVAFADVAIALWIAHGGPAFMRTLPP
jgi:GAF domain